MLDKTRRDGNRNEHIRQKIKFTDNISVKLLRHLWSRHNQQSYIS